VGTGPRNAVSHIEKKSGRREKKGKEREGEKGNPGIRERLSRARRSRNRIQNCKQNTGDVAGEKSSSNGGPDIAKRER